MTILAAALMTAIGMNANTLENKQKVNDDFDVVVAEYTDNVADHDVVTRYSSNKQLRCDYQIDGLGRVVSKTIYGLNNANEWAPLSIYTVTFGNNEVIVNYATYNKKTDDFRNNFEQVRYNAHDCKQFLNIPAQR